MIPESEVEKIIGDKGEWREVRAIIYARVSSSDQKSDLERQVQNLLQYCSAKGYRVVDVVSDVASGLKTNRRGLLKLFNYVVNRQVDVVVITYKDRLTRFGFEYLEYFFRQYGVRVEEVMREEREPLEELIEDFIDIIVSFAGRIYGKRSKRIKQLVEINRRFLEQNPPSNR